MKTAEHKKKCNTSNEARGEESRRGCLTTTTSLSDFMIRKHTLKQKQKQKRERERGRGRGKGLWDSQIDDAFKQSAGS